MAKRQVEKEMRRVVFEFEEDELAKLIKHDPQYKDSYGKVYIQLNRVESFDSLLAYLTIQIMNQS